MVAADPRRGEGRPEAASELLESELKRAQESGRLDRQLETRLLLAMIDLDRGHQGQGLQSLRILASEAEELGFYRVAFEARRLISQGTSGPGPP